MDATPSLLAIFCKRGPTETKFSLLTTSFERIQLNWTDVPANGYQLPISVLSCYAVSKGTGTRIYLSTYAYLTLTLPSVR